MSDERRRVVEAAIRSLGPTEVLADLSWPHGEAVVLELWSGGRRVDRQGVPAAGEVRQRAARLRAVGAGDRRPGARPARCRPGRAGAAVQPRRRSPGRDVGGPLLDLHRRAGVLAGPVPRRRPPGPLDGYLDAQRGRLDDWVRRARPGLLADDEVATVAAHLAAVAELPDPWGVPCHRDWQPRNWLVDRHGELWAIDFEHARVGPWFEDVRRLWWDQWQRRAGAGRGVLRRLRPRPRRRRASLARGDVGAVAPDDDRVGRRARRRAVHRRSAAPGSLRCVPDEDRPGCAGRLRRRRRSAGGEGRRRAVRRGARRARRARSARPWRRGSRRASTSAGRTRTRR